LKTMVGYIALCDLQGNVNKVIRSAPLRLVNEGQNVRSLFCSADALDQLFYGCREQCCSAHLKMAGEEGLIVGVTVRQVGDQLLFLMYGLQDMDELAELMEFYVSLLEELKLVQQEPYEASYYQIQRVNNQLMNYQRALAKANVRLKVMLEEAKEAKNTIELLERDPVTSLYTETAFYRHAEELLREHGDLDFDIIALDIERFKMVNDAFGTETGNRLLSHVALCLLNIQTLGKSLFTRARADMFFALVPRAEGLYDRLDQNIGDLLENYPLPMRLQVKVGVYAIENHEITVPRMCDRALLAVRSIKGIFGKRLAFYDDSMRVKMLLEQKIIDSMEEALRIGQFQIYIQPKVEIATARPIGAEVLVRWFHPEYGMIPPSEFIPVFEKNGFIYALDQFVWKKACELLNRLKQAGKWDIPLSVNVSRVDIYQPNLKEVLTALVSESGLAQKDLHLEITETAYGEDTKQLLAVVHQLKEQGFVIEMDDFGNGYSSLNTLSELPIDVLKLDLKFLELGRDVNRRRTIMQFVVNLAEALNLQVIAEGVETEEQVALLQEMDCRCAQGYFYGRPMPVEEFCTYMEKSSS